MNQFNLNNQFHLYLQRVGLNVDIMSTEQVTETRRAFMGACGQMLDLLSEGMVDIPEDKGVAILGELFEQVEDFWNNEIVHVVSLIPLVKISEEHFDSVFPGIQGMFSTVVAHFDSLFGLHMAIAEYGEFDSYSKLVTLGYDVEFKLDQP